MFDYKKSSFRALLALIALSLVTSCADTETDTSVTTPRDQNTENFQQPIFHYEKSDHEILERDIDFDGPTADIGPDNVVPIGSNDAARELFKSGVARFEYANPFQQVSWMMDASDVSELAYRTQDQDNNWSDWKPVEITWNEGYAYNALIRLDQPTNVIEMRGGEFIETAEFEFYPVVMAREVFITATEEDEIPSPINGLDQPSPDQDDLRSIQQHVAPSTLVIPRASWNALKPAQVCGSVVKPYRMTIHHTYSPSNDGPDPAARMRGMQNYHMNNLGWCDIGYHFVVSQSGKIYQGRSRSNRPGAHTGNQNSGNVGISFIADFTTQTPSSTQLNAGAKITRWVHDTHGVPLNRTVFKGHREWPGQSTTCPGNSMMNRLQNILDLAKGNPPVNPEPTITYKTDVKTNFLKLENFYTQGSSANIPDALVGQKFQAEILLHNQSNGVIRGVQLNYFIESPYLTATNYVIQTDHPAKDRKTWVTNDANDVATNPAKNAMGTSGTLTMNAFSAGETKRVLIDLQATRYSIGQADHPDVRGWISNIDSVYKQAGWNDAPSLNKLTGTTKAFAQLDVLSTQEWQFASTKNADDLEGWTGRGAEHFDQLRQNLNAAMLAQHITGNDSGIVSPAWTSIDADKFDQLVFHARSHDGNHTKAIYWARDGESFSEDRVIRFEALGDGETHPYVIPMASHPQWNGTITQLRIDQLDKQAPVEGDSGWYDLANIYFQSSTDQKTNSATSTFESTPPVQILTEGNEEPETPDPTPTPEPSPGPDIEKPVEPETPALDGPGDGVTVNSGCSTIAIQSAAPKTPYSFLLLGAGLLALSWIRRKF